MNLQAHDQLKNHIWEIANRLRGPYRPPQYRLVMLPMVVLRRLDSVLEPTKDAVLKEYDKLTAQNMPESAMERLLGRAADPDPTASAVQHQPLHVQASAWRRREHRAQPRRLHQRLLADGAQHLRAVQVHRPDREARCQQPAVHHREGDGRRRPAPGSHRQPADGLPVRAPGDALQRAGQRGGWRPLHAARSHPADGEPRSTPASRTSTRLASTAPSTTPPAARAGCSRSPKSSSSRRTRAPTSRSSGRSTTTSPGRSAARTC